MRACAVGTILLCLAVVGCGNDDGSGGSTRSAAATGTTPGGARAAAPLDGGVPVLRETPLDARATLTGQPATSLTRVGGTTYATGVGWLGAYRGSGLRLSADDGRLTGAVGTDGQVSDALPDGRGGLYVAGDFRTVRGVARRGVARLRADGTLDPAFRVRTPTLRLATSLALGGGRLYVGGTPVGYERGRGTGLVALDPRTGAPVRGFRPDVRGVVTEIELHGGRLYVGGALPGPRYVPVDRRGRRVRRAPTTVPLPVRALDARSGRRSPGFVAPRVADAEQGQISALRVVGGRLWVASAMIASGRAAPHQLLPVRLLDPRTGAERATSAARGDVLELLRDGSRVVAVGRLRRTTGGRAADLAQAFDARTGARRGTFAVAADPRVGPYEVAADGVLVGGRLTLAGSGRVQGAGRPIGPGGPLPDAGFVGRYSATSGASDRGATNPVPDGPVNALARTRAGIFAGGTFAAVDVRPTDLAAFDATTGRPSAAPVPSVPGAQAVVAAAGLVWVTDGEGLIGFDPASGETRRRIALPYPHRGAREGRDVVRLTAAGDRVFVFAGSPVIRGAADDAVVAYDAATGRRVPFRIPLRPSERGAQPVLLGTPDALYAAGSFVRTRPDGTPANLAVLRLDPSDGRLDEAFDPHVDGPVTGLGLVDGKLLLGGYFRATPRARPGAVVAVDPRTGARDTSFPALRTPIDTDNRFGTLQGAPVVRRQGFRGSVSVIRRDGTTVAPKLRGARYVATTDDGDLAAGGASGLLGLSTPAGYGIVETLEP